MSEEELRREAVRRRLVDESPSEIAEAVGTTRWVRKWVARHDEDGHADGCAESRSRAPHRSPTRTSAELTRILEQAISVAGVRRRLRRARPSSSRTRTLR